MEVWIFFDYNTPGTHYIDTWDRLEEEMNLKAPSTWEELIDFVDELMQGKITFDDAVFKEAAEKIKELNEHHAFPKEYMNTGVLDADAFTKEVKKS